MPFIAPQPKKLTPKEDIQEDYKKVKKEEKKHDKKIMEDLEEKPKKEKNPFKDILINIKHITQDVIRRYGNNKTSYVLENDIPPILDKFNWKVIINSKGKKEVVDNNGT